MSHSRREFLKGCCAGALALGTGRAFGFFDPFATKAGSTREILVHVFLRGGMDGLHLVVPYSGAERTAYEAKRGDLVIPTSRLRAIGSTGWAWHPRAGGGVSESRFTNSLAAPGTPAGSCRKKATLVYT